jgi:uncharacterized protein
MRTFFNTGIISFLLFLLTGSLQAQNFPEKPVPQRLVNDFAGMLSQDEVNALEAKLVKYYDTTSNQIAIVIVADLDGYEVSDYAFELGEKWGIGIKGRDNGILILVKPRTNEGQGKVFIATGYGAEGAVPDAACKLIVDNEIIPRFRNGEFYAGLDAATTVIFSLMKGEYTWADYKGKKPEGSAPGGIAAGLLVLFVFIVFVVMGIKQSKRAHTLSGSSIPWWIWAGMMSSAGSKKSGSNWGSFNSGSGIFGSGGGGGGGGFGGFGGGSFGGGGAGGSW